MSTPIIVEDIRPLIALIAPRFGLIGIMLAGEKRANLRELITFVGSFGAGGCSAFDASSHFGRKYY